MRRTQNTLLSKLGRILNIASAPLFFSCSATINDKQSFYLVSESHPFQPLFKQIRVITLFILSLNLK